MSEEPGSSGSFTVRWGNITLSVVGMWAVVIVGVLLMLGAFLYIMKNYLDAVHVEHVGLYRSLDRIERRVQDCPAHDAAP